MPSLDINLLRQVSGVGASTIRNIIAAGYQSIDDIKGASLEQLTAISGIGEATAQAMLDFLARLGDAGDLVRTYRYDEKRKNIPSAELAAQGRVQEQTKIRYSYDPHLPPVLRFAADGSPDKLPELLETAKQRPLTSEEAKLLAEALRNQQPWLEWTSKQEKRWFDVDPVALHIHERISAEAIVRLAQRQPLQRSLFADPELPYQQEVDFYKHDVDWANRLILGDSLTVMTSLAKREDLAGKVQMIYIDPPYGINYRSNFQPFVNQRDVSESENDLTREPEQVKAYRDTWTLGVHSYLAYIRDRLVAAKELLADTGSIFLQISDENVHRLRILLDEIFGASNQVATIAWKKASPDTKTIRNVFNYLLWYAKDIESAKVFKLYDERGVTHGATDNVVKLALWTEFPDGYSRPLTQDEKLSPDLLPTDATVFRVDKIVNRGTGDRRFAIDFNGEDIWPPTGFSWRGNPDEIRRLQIANRINSTRTGLGYKFYLSDYPVIEMTNFWDDTAGYVPDMVYVVQTHHKIIERCLLMTTRPGDLVLDPTCGSGTTAYLAEQWGRRWITIDTSRVAVALARQRLLTSRFDYYEKQHPSAALDPEKNLFVYKTVPHITRSVIAQNQALDSVAEKWKPVLTEKLTALNATLGLATEGLRVRLRQKHTAKAKQEGKLSITDADTRRWLLPPEKWNEWEVPFDTDPDWPKELQEALTDYRKAWRQKMDEVNATIAASAPQETLVDQPKVVKNVVRVSGPFTVEGVQPAEENLNWADSPIGGAPDELETFDNEAFAGNDTHASNGQLDPTNAEAYIDRMIGLMRQSGVRFLGNKQVSIDRLEHFQGGVYLHAEGEWNLQDEDVPRRLAVSFGPQYGPLTAKQVEDSLWEASRRGFDDIVFAGFDIDGTAQAIIEANPNPRVRCHTARISPDVLMGNLLKNSATSHIFTVTGTPRVELEKIDGEYVVTMEGMDVYDPVNNEIFPTRATDVAAWFLDCDYDGKTFCVSQAFFPKQDAWDKLARALKTFVEPEQFAAFSGTRSLPFAAGKHKRIAVKVIDPRGNEVMRVMQLDGVRYG